MAFAIRVLGRMPVGNMLEVHGVYTNTSSSTGGDIASGLKRVETCQLQPKGSSVLANQPVVNETLPLAGGDVTIVTTADEVGTFTIRGTN